MFRLSRFLNKYTVRNKLSSKISETDLHPNDRKFPRNESLDQRPPAYHDNKSFGGKPKPLLGAKREA